MNGKKRLAQVSSRKRRQQQMNLAPSRAELIPTGPSRVELSRELARGQELTQQVVDELYETFKQRALSGNKMMVYAQRCG